MTTTQALLPEGLYDLLPLEAKQERELQNIVLKQFHQYGYQEVKPPLIEFESSLLARTDSELDRQTFRMMDPLSQQMLGLRADMTMQISRIASTRLSNDPHPLRLCYAGDALRVRGSSLRAERQCTQAGIELIGVDNARADAEVIMVTLDALNAMGIEGVSIDLTLPTLIPALIAGEVSLGDAEKSALQAAIAFKDGSTLHGQTLHYHQLYTALIGCQGISDEILPQLSALHLPDSVKPLVTRLTEIIALVHAHNPDITITIDPTESRGFDYHTGISFTFYARNIAEEIGRGGRYTPAFSAAEQSATGSTIYINPLLRHLPATESTEKVCIPASLPQPVIEALHKRGLTTITALNNSDNLTKEAKHHGCHYIWQDEELVKVEA